MEPVSRPHSSLAPKPPSARPEMVPQPDNDVDIGVPTIVTDETFLGASLIAGFKDSLKESVLSRASPCQPVAPLQFQMIDEADEFLCQEELRVDTSILQEPSFTHQYQTFPSTRIQA